MTKQDSGDRYSRWRSEHARDADTDSTPRSAATDAVDTTSEDHRLGVAALSRLSPGLSQRITRYSGSLELFGSGLARVVSTDEIPSRIRIHQNLYEQNDGAEVSLEEIKQRRRELLIEQIPDEEIAKLARTACRDTSPAQDGPESEQERDDMIANETTA
ncbi:MAG: hypothetical protein J07HB67_00579 [halophilic archaeon J07HB67]|nr:MAG: hypothetical protein J07HB67_00579 [halophilic archaeon J07HB67]